MNVIYKIFNDAVHGHMLFHPLLVEMINTIEVQRLRNLKQTGFAYYVYPASSHNRFEHSLGTCHLAGKLMIALQRSTIAEVYRPTEEEVLCVQIAGLCHDLGHGPFSHSWEHFISKADPNQQWKHEQSSIEMMERMMKNKRVKKKMAEYKLTDEHIQLIKNIILVPEKLDHPKHYLFQIISNNDNDVDVDKWDYILRDQKQLNIFNTFDVNRMIEYSQIILVRKDKTDRAEICFRDKEVLNVYNMLLARATLHEKAYQHRVVQIIENMVINAFLEAHKACPEWRMTDTNVDHLLTFTDTIFERILYSTEPQLKKARDLLIRVQNRYLYKCIAEFDILDQEIDDETEYFERCGDLIYNHLCNNNEYNIMKREDFEVIQIKIDMGKKFNSKGLNCFKFEKNSSVAKICKFEDNKHFLTKNLTQVLVRKLLIVYKGTVSFDVTSLEELTLLLKKLNKSIANKTVKRKVPRVDPDILIKKERLIDIDT